MFWLIHFILNSKKFKSSLKKNSPLMKDCLIPNTPLKLTNDIAHAPKLPFGSAIQTRYAIRHLSPLETINWRLLNWITKKNVFIYQQSFFSYFYARWTYSNPSFYTGSLHSPFPSLFIYSIFEKPKKYILRIPHSCSRFSRPAVPKGNSNTT